jgi:outer membrane protein assembly factor BamA
MKSILHIVFFTCSVLFCCNYTLAQTDSTSVSDTLEEKRNSLFGLPLVFFTPETNWRFGAAGIYTFRFKNEKTESRPSQFQLGFAYTLNKQILMYLPYQLYFKDLGYSIYGELGYYVYTYNFYGVGNNHPDDFVETYGVTYPRIRLNALRQIKPGYFLGLRYWFEDFQITDLDSEGQLVQEDFVAGSKGGITSGAGIVFNYDTRDNYFSPSKGAFVEAVIHNNSGLFGSAYNYTRFRVDASKYVRFKWKHVAAVNLFTDWVSGDPPFNQMALLGGTKKMRGLYEGRLRDKNLMLVQAEYRAPLFWRFGMVAFINYGGVANELGNFQLKHFESTYGAGLRIRINDKEKINVRIDAGFGKDGPGYYLTIGEAF